MPSPARRRSTSPGGMSGFVGALAPELALAGFEAQDDAIEEALGKLVGDGFDPKV